MEGGIDVKKITENDLTAFNATAEIELIFFISTHNANELILVSLR